MKWYSICWHRFSNSRAKEKVEYGCEWCERDAAVQRGCEVVHDGGQGGAGGASGVWARGQEDEERKEVQGIVR